MRAVAAIAIRPPVAALEIAASIRAHFGRRAPIAWFLLGPPSPAYGTTLEMPRSFRRDFMLSPIGPLQSA